MITSRIVNNNCDFEEYLNYCSFNIYYLLAVCTLWMQCLAVTDLGVGTRRHKVLVSHDSSALLNELRREAAARDREARRQHMMEKRQSYEMFMLSLQSWEDSLLEGQQLSAMWEVCHLLSGCDRSFIFSIKGRR